VPRLSVLFLRAALLHLATGVTLGALLLAHKGLPFAPWLWRLLESHVEFVFVGWTLQLAIGVAVWILPRLPGSARYGRERAGGWAFLLLNAGVLAVALGRCFGNDTLALTVAGRVSEFLAMVLFVVQVWPRIRALTLAQPANSAS
jgi:hypothetical protein